jgi:hypothetical protein
MSLQSEKNTVVVPYHLKDRRGREEMEEEMESERKEVMDVMVPGRVPYRGEGRVLSAKEEMNHRDSERIIHQLAFELPGKGLFGVRRRRERLKSIRFSVVIDELIPLLWPFVRI